MTLFRNLLFAFLLLLPSLGYAQVPNYASEVQFVRELYPEAWACAHTSRACAEDFVKLVASYLHYEVDPQVGLNGKRGGEELSQDVIAYPSANGKSRDVNTGAMLAVIDFIGGAGGPNPTVTWGEVWDPANIPTKARWIKPARVHDTAPAPPNPTPTPPAPTPTPVDLTPILQRLDAQVAQAQQLLERLAAVEALVLRVEQQVHANGLEVLEVKNLALNPVPYKGRVLGFSATLRPEPR